MLQCDGWSCLQGTGVVSEVGDQTPGKEQSRLAAEHVQDDHVPAIAASRRNQIRDVMAVRLKARTLKPTQHDRS
jgi:hypothetical protein